MKALDAEPTKLKPGEDPRLKLVDWMVDPKKSVLCRIVTFAQ